jgi:hypothetical protein
MIAAGDRVSWWLIAIMTVTCILASHGLGFRIEMVRAAIPAGGLAILCAAAAIGRMRDRPRLYAGAVAFLQMTLFTIIGVVLSYALAARAGALWDHRFAAADHALGFDWPAVFATADRSAAALWVGGIAYHSLTVQMIVAIVVLSATGREARLRTAVVAAILAGFVTILISGVTPAMGNVVDPAGYLRLWPSIAWLEQDMLRGLRDGTWRVLDLTQLMGIVSFPSYHATLPMILVWAQRDVRGWRLVAPIWAGLTIVATPLFGGHYGVDVLAGMILAVAALRIAPRLLRMAAIPAARDPVQASAASIAAAAADAPSPAFMPAASRDAACR